MPTIIFKQNDGAQVETVADIGDKLMEVARDADVEGILAECGGACACATCHVVLSDNLAKTLAAVDETESMVLEGALNVEKNSRLSCQITVSAEMDGAVIVVPAGLY